MGISELIIIIIAFFVLGLIKPLLDKDFFTAPLYMVLVGQAVPRLASVAFALSVFIAIYELFVLSAKIHLPTIRRFHPFALRFLFRLATCYFCTLFLSFILFPISWNTALLLASVLLISTFAEKGGGLKESLYIESLLSPILAVVLCLAFKTATPWPIFIGKEVFGGLFLGALLGLIFGKMHPRLLFFLPFLGFLLSISAKISPFMTILAAGLLVGHRYRVHLLLLVRQRRGVFSDLLLLPFVWIISQGTFWGHWQVWVFALAVQFFRFIGYWFSLGKPKLALFATCHCYIGSLSLVFAFLFLPQIATSAVCAATLLSLIFRLVPGRFVSLAEEPAYLGVGLCR